MAPQRPQRKKGPAPAAETAAGSVQPAGLPGGSTRAEPPLSFLPESLEWSYNPWRDHRGPALRHPLSALLLTIAIALIAGWSVSYPNYSDEYLKDLRYAVENGRYTSDVPVEIRVAGETPLVVREANRLKLQQIEHQLVYWPAQMLGWAVLSFALLFGLTAMVYLPASYRLDHQGVAVRFLGTASLRNWSHYRNYYFHDTGVHLTTMPKPSPLDPFRGHYLRYRGNRQEVELFIREKMQAWKGRPATT